MIQFTRTHRSYRLKPGMIRAITGLLLLVMTASSGFVVAATKDDVSQLRQLAQLAEYVGVDYVKAVKNGRVINADEYREMVGFSTLLVQRNQPQASQSKRQRAIVAQARALWQAVHDKRSVAVVGRLSITLRSALLARMPQLELPQRLLPHKVVLQVYQARCSGCHGLSGRGDGPRAALMDPLPINFHDRARAEKRSILGLFDTISNGIKDTEMPAFKQLSDEQRWSLAFYVGGLAFKSEPHPSVTDAPPVSLTQLVNQSPIQLAASLPPASKKELGGLRAAPGRLFSKPSKPLSVARSGLNAAHQAYLGGDYRLASRLAVAAYLDGFELVENTLDAQDQTLRKAIEVNMMKLRQLMNKPQNKQQVDGLLAQTLGQLDDAQSLLNGSELSSGTLFTASLVILLREGLEALLVVIALITVLIRTQRQDALKYVHLGWVGALLAGAATWLVAESLISISGASRELMEGVTSLFAAVVLFYVGIWMHSKTQASHWQAYIQRHVNARLQSGALWGIAGLAFIAVYRETFETVLFYQSLMAQASHTQVFSISGGAILGAVSLFVIAWLLIRYSIRLPIAKFFASTTYLLLALSFVLMGKGISAMQEAAWINITPLPVSFSIDWIGVKSTWQGILAQSAVLVLFAIFLLRARLKQRLR